MDKFEKARKLFRDLEKKGHGKSVAAVVARVKKLGGDINQEALRRFRIGQRLAEIRQCDEIKKAIEIEV